MDGNPDDTSKLHANVKEFARFCERTYGLQKVDNIKPHTVEAYVRSMHDRGLAPSTMADRMTAVRVMAQAVGKANIAARENAAGLYILTNLYR